LLVDLRGRFSNPEVRAVVVQVAQLADGIKVEEDQNERPALAPQRQRWRLVDRLSEQIIRDLLRDRQTGTTHRALAERYGISLSSVKRVLRQHRG
jgi:DNA invertase Pin-like site-specific DNA recombinase